VQQESPDTATATNIARCGTKLAQRYISTQPASTKTRRLARTPREDAHKSSYPPHNLTPMLLLPCDSIHIQVHAGGVQESGCTSATP
jgi:hypothetical protein